MPYSLLIIVVIIFFLFRKSKKKRNSKNSAVYTNSKRVPSNSYCEVYVYGDELFSTLTYKNSKGFAKSELVVVDVKDKQYPGRVVELYSERPDNLDPSIRCREVVRKLSIEDKGKVAFWSRKIENFLNPKSEKEIGKIKEELQEKFEEARILDEYLQPKAPVLSERAPMPVSS